MAEVSAPAAPPLLQVRDLVQEFAIRNAGGMRGARLRAVAGVSFEVARGETLGVVGETGSGKSTLARAILQAPRPVAGQVVFDGVDLTRQPSGQLTAARRALQMVFQDPFGSLDPRWPVSEIVAAPLAAAGMRSRAQRRRRVGELLELVGLDLRVHGGRRPRQLSGGQCQRVAIARAIATSPKLLICDEAVSSLDVLVQAQILSLFDALRGELALAYLFIAHDLALVRQVSDRVLVMYLGRICEIGPAEEIFAAPRHPYTRALLAAVPSADPDASHPRSDEFISGELPNPVHPPSGCRFRTRCPRAAARCAEQTPELQPAGAGHLVACHFPLESHAAGTGALAGQVLGIGGSTAETEDPA